MGPWNEARIPVISARDFALAELDAKRLPGWPSDLLRARGTAPSSNPPADPRDRALGEQIITGVTKHLLYLQWLTAHFAQRSLRRIDPIAQKVLAIGIYQLRFLSRVPSSAVVDEAVKQAKRVGHAHAAGFINAVLRKATRESDPPPPERVVDPAGYAEAILSHPADLFARLVNLLGPVDALRFCEHDDLEPPVIVRVYQGVTANDLACEGVNVAPHEQPGLYVVSPGRAPVLADWAERGIAQAQDPTPAAVVGHMQIEAQHTVLDRCCGFGTKTFQIQELLTSGHIVAMDPSENRLRALRHLLERRHIKNVSVHKIGMMEQLPSSQIRTFDRILADVPCSNSGVLARRPEARYAQDDKSIASVMKLQDRIFEDCASALKPGGRLVYSTCSVWPDENEMRVAQFIQRHPEYQLVSEVRTLPSFDVDPARYHDGGYYAVLTRG